LSTAGKYLTAVISLWMVELATASRAADYLDLPVARPVMT
jgi:hypothetical protein